MVVFESGRPRNSEYRRFKIKQVEGPNDIACHQEILRRRFRKAIGGSMPISEGISVAELIQDSQQSQVTRSDKQDEKTSEMHLDWALPDLIIVDGGKGQLSGAMEVLRELNLAIPAIGVAKEEGSHTKMNTAEQIFIPGSSDPIILPRTSQALYLIQRIRDEAHRFSITYHRKVRSDRTFKSVLDEIPGIGPKRKQALMKHFGLIGAIGAASIDELAALDGMTHDAAEKVKEYIGKME